MRNRIASKYDVERISDGALGTHVMSGPLGLRTLPSTLPHVLPNDNTCPGLRLCATMRPLYILPNDNTRPQTEASHPPTLYITANLPQVASAPLGQPRH